MDNLNKNRGVVKRLFFAFVGMIIITNIQAASSESLVVNKENSTLLAPEAASYQWSLNGKVLSETSGVLNVSTSGEYKVILTDENGATTESTITLQVKSDGEVVVIYTIGDSTVQDYNSGYYPRTGWGQVLQYFFDTNYVKVDNRAVGGTSSKSFYNQYWKEDGSYEQIVTELDTGDFVFVQFGINDRSTTIESRYAPYDTFKVYLRKYVAEITAKGAIPVLVSTVRRNSWDNDSTSYDAYHEHPRATREVAAELGVPLVDLDGRSEILMDSLGRSYVQPFWYMMLDAGEYSNYTSGNTDNVHFQRTGAIEMARLVVDELLNDTAYPVLDTITQHVTTMHKITVNQNDDDAGIVNRTAYFPEGVKENLKARPNTGYSFVEWQNESGETLSTDLVYTLTTGDSDTSFTAVYEYVGIGGSELWIEAECGDVGSEWIVEEDSLASYGNYVTIEDEDYSTGNSSAGSGSEDRITYTFEVTGGAYNVYVRLLFPTTSGGDSYWMRLDVDTWSKISWDKAYTEWTWKQALSAVLTDGEHTLSIAGREPLAQIDKFHIGSTIPDSIGTIDSSYCNQNEDETVTDTVAETAIAEYDLSDGFSQKIWTDESQGIHISYNLEKSANVQCFVYSSVGQLIYQESLGNINAGEFSKTLSLDLKPGMYILKSVADEQYAVQKFIFN